MAWWPSPDFPQFFFCPRACTNLHRAWACKMDDGVFEFVYRFNNNFNPFRSFLSLPFAGSSLHRNQNFNSSFLSFDGFRPSASVRIKLHATIAVAILELLDARGFPGLALVLLVTIPPERSATMKVGYNKCRSFRCLHKNCYHIFSLVFEKSYLWLF